MPIFEYKKRTLLGINKAIRGCRGVTEADAEEVQPQRAGGRRLSLLASRLTKQPSTLGRLTRQKTSNFAQLGKKGGRDLLSAAKALSPSRRSGEDRSASEEVLAFGVGVGGTVGRVASKVYGLQSLRRTAADRRASQAACLKDRLPDKERRLIGVLRCVNRFAPGSMPQAGTAFKPADARFANTFANVLAEFASRSHASILRLQRAVRNYLVRQKVARTFLEHSRSMRDMKNKLLQGVAQGGGAPASTPATSSLKMQRSASH